MKSKEELNELKKEVESVSEKVRELTPEELAQVSGGAVIICDVDCKNCHDTTCPQRCH